LAAATAEAIGQTMTAAAFRQQLSRARREFARLLCEEVAETIRVPSLQLVREELSDLGLLHWLERHLSD
jgi:hypothetical protein